MSDAAANVSIISAGSLGAGAGIGVMATVTSNATAITAIATVCFGIIYACCAIWNAYSNHRRNRVNERHITESIIE